MRVTLKDIASEVGVTVGTVSHVLNGHNDISEATKQKVLQAAEKLGYISDGVAGSLRSGKTDTVAVIVPDISNFLLSRQIKAIEEEAAKVGCTAVIFNTNEDPEMELQAIKTAYGKRADGILICPVQSGGRNNAAFLEKTGLPFVMFSRYFRDIDTDYVCSDDEHGGYIAAGYLMSKGCRLPLYVGAAGNPEGSQDRYAGACRAFCECGIRSVPQTAGDPRGGDGDRIAEYFCAGGFDSMIIFSDIMAFDIESALLKRGHTIGEIPIVSFDITHAFMHLPFRHTSVGMIDESLAREAFGILIRRMRGEKFPPVHRLIDVSLRIFE